VRKSGENINRLFWSCGISQRNRCNFFDWADAKFPKCLHGKVSILRRVLKPGSNNGKYFFCCGGDKESQCKYFSWIDDVKQNHNSDGTQSLKRRLSETANDENKDIIGGSGNNKCSKSEPSNYRFRICSDEKVPL
jgi:hypothetical protein